MAGNGSAQGTPQASQLQGVDANVFNDTIAAELANEANNIAQAIAQGITRDTAIPLLGRAGVHLQRLTTFVVTLYAWVKEAFVNMNARIEGNEQRVVAAEASIVSLQRGLTDAESAVEGVVAQA